MFLNSRKLVGKYVSGLIPEKIPNFSLCNLNCAQEIGVIMISEPKPDIFTESSNFRSL